MRSPSLQLADEDYPQVSTSLGPQSSYSAGVFVRLGRAAVGALIHTPFDLSLDALATGLAARLKTTDQEDPSSEVTFFGSADLSLAFRARVFSHALGVAYELRDGLTAGASLEHLSGDVDVTGRFDIQGLMVTAGTERAFNDPNDPWNNDLYANLRARYQGGTTRLRFGTSYRLSQKMKAGLYVATTSGLKLRGTTDFVQYTLPGLNLDAAEGEDMLDPTKISLDEPTRTKRVENPTGKELAITLPGAVGLGLTGQVGGLILATSLSVPVGPFALEHVLEKPGYRKLVRVEVSSGIRFGFGLKVYGFVLDLALRSLHVSTQLPDGNSETDVLLPELDLGYHFRVSRYLTASVQLLSLPYRLAFLGVNYAF